MQIITNNVPRDIVYGYELTEEERKEFDYIDFDSDDGSCHDFVRYKGEVVDLAEMSPTMDGDGTRPATSLIPQPNKWDGYRSDSFFSGILVRFINDNEQVIMGRYYT